MPPTDAPRESPSISRRKVLAATAWAVPVVAVATAAPAFATSDNTGFWVADVRTTNRNQPANLMPGFRFGYAGASPQVGSAVVTFVSAQSGLTFSQIFNVFDGIEWSFTQLAGSGPDYTYTATASFSCGPSNPTNPVSGVTKGVTVKGLVGTYSVLFGINGDQKSASFTIV